MQWPVTVAVSLLAALAILGFLCAVAETALLSLGRLRLRQWRQGRGAPSLAASLLDRPEELLSTLSLANTLANGGVFVISVKLALDREWNPWWTLSLAFLGILVIGEVLPKTLAVRAPERWALRTAAMVAVFQRVTRPFQRLAQATLEMALRRFAPDSGHHSSITDEEYRELLDMAVQHGALRSSEREIIAELITLDRRHASDVMRPRATMAAVSDELSVEEMVQAARKYRHRRLPIYDETPDTIVGVLNTRQFLLDPERRLENALEFPSFVPETMNLLQLFQALQRQKRSLALVLDEFGAVSGVVRMEDILAELLGDMPTEGPVTGFVMEKLGAGRWRVSGVMRLEDFRREYPALPEFPEVETLGGLLMSQLDVVPAAGESATIGGLRLTATVVDERRIHELSVERISGR